jgi:hypothetical protein
MIWVYVLKLHRPKYIFLLSRRLVIVKHNIDMPVESPSPRELNTNFAKIIPGLGILLTRKQ